ncbi:MAG: hypothetical protein ACPGRC_11240 [Salibacteraceae bacterium]
MKAFTLVLMALVFLSCSNSIKPNEQVISEHPFLIGKWAGTGNFLNQEFDKEIGPLHIVISISNKKINAIFNNQELKNVTIQPTNYGFEIQGKLTNELNSKLKTGKDKLVVLLVIPEVNQESTNEVDANFHLKNNFNFDYSMKVGGVNLKKE